MFTPEIRTYYLPLGTLLSNLLFSNELLTMLYPQTKCHFIANYCKLQVQGRAAPCFQRAEHLGSKATLGQARQKSPETSVPLLGSKKALSL